MKYTVKKLAMMYNEYLTHSDFDLKISKSQTFNISTYNEYEYKKLMAQFDKLYDHADTLELTEKFLKGD